MLDLSAQHLALTSPARTYPKSPAVVAPVYDWSGFYIGLNGGGASSRECWTITSNAGVALAPTPSEGCHSATGGFVGGQVQLGEFVDQDHDSGVRVVHRTGGLRLEQRSLVR